MTKVGVVLGAGGLTGMAYHAGTLAALADAGFDARTAQLVVGTSAGSVMGATLRAGFPPKDLLARATNRPMTAEGQRLASRVGAPGPPPRRPRVALGSRPASPGLLLRGRPGLALAGLLPAGSFPTDAIVARVRAMADGPWPEAPLWICAVRLSDGKRVVFGRDVVPGVDVGSAVAASSAIPGFFEPVAIGEHRYVDGGTHSPTNADLLAGEGFDIVVISSPMSGTTATIRRPSLDTRGLHALTLATEVRRLRRSGSQVLTFQPTPADAELMGGLGGAMDPSRGVGVAQRAYESASARLASDRVADQLALLTGRGLRRSP
jgi:NTE family protein